MIRLILFVSTLVFLSNCSISETSRIWNDKEEKIENQKNIKKLFDKEKKIITELNPDLKLDLSRFCVKSSTSSDEITQPFPKPAGIGLFFYISYSLA